MAQQDILDYIRKTPHNSNVNVVKGMLGNSESSSLPEVTTDDNGDVLTVVNGEWDKAELDLGYECTEIEAVFFNGSITTQNTGAGFAFGEFTPAQAISGDTLTVIIDDTEYELPKTDVSGQEAYGEFNDNGPIFTTYPCVILPAGQFVTQNPGTYTVKISSLVKSAITTDCFKSAVKSVAKTLEHILDGTANGSLRSNTSTPEGNEYALGNGAVAVGTNTQANGNKSHAEGWDTIADGEASHAEGKTTTATGQASHAEGELTNTGAPSSHAEGYKTTASGFYSHAEGTNTTASGNASHAEGDGTIASRGKSHAEGESTYASGDTSHAEGSSTHAQGYASHAEGSVTKASGFASHAQNQNTIAQGYAQTAIGTFNVAQGNATIANATDYAFIIGNGTGLNNCSNAFAIKWDGTFVFADGTEITPAQFAQILALLN